jgi:hypothetical protein
MIQYFFLIIHAGSIVYLLLLIFELIIYLITKNSKDRRIR